MTKPIEASELLGCVDSLIQGKENPLVYLALADEAQEVRLTSELTRERYRVCSFRNAAEIQNQVVIDQPEAVVMDQNFFNTLDRALFEDMHQKTKSYGSQWIVMRKEKQKNVAHVKSEGLHLDCNEDDLRQFFKILRDARRTCGLSNPKTKKSD